MVQVDLVGLAAAFVAILFFGSNFVPIKNYKTGDGMYFQFILCVGIWLVGVVVFLIRGCPEFRPIVMLGGALWATGNLFTVAIVQRIGLGIGLLIWGFSSMITGWASARFGILGLNADVISNPTLNTVGTLFAVASLPLYLLVKTTVGNENSIREIAETGSISSYSSEDSISQSHVDIKSEEETSPLLEKHPPLTDSRSLERLRRSIQEDKITIDNKAKPWDKLFGYALALFSGLCYGVNFNPSQWTMDNVKGASQNGLDYVFPHFCGILLASTTYFIIYIIYKKNKPQIYAECTLPAIVSGCMWAVAQSSWFVANQRLSPSIAFPIVTSGPGLIASIVWGVLVFKEIRGLKNYLVLGLSLLLVITSGVLTSMSK